MNCALSHPPRQCPAYKDHCKYCDDIGHREKCCRKKKSDSRQESDGRRQKVVYRQQQTSKNRSQSDFSRSPKPIDECLGTPQKTTETTMMPTVMTTENHSTSSRPPRKAAQPPHVMKCMPTWTLFSLTSLVYVTSN